MYGGLAQFPVTASLNYEGQMLFSSIRGDEDPPAHVVQSLSMLQSDRADWLREGELARSKSRSRYRF
jgi:hypothetical protein